MDMEHIKALFFHPSPALCSHESNGPCHRNTPRATVCTCAVFRGLLYRSVSADITETVGPTLVLTPVLSMPCERTQSSPQCWRLKGALHILPTRAHVWGLCAFRATSTPAPCSFALRGGCSMICGYGGHHRSSRWLQHPVHHCTGTHPCLTPVEPPPTTASSTHHCHIESLLPLQKIFLQWLAYATVEPTCFSFG
jgi:hypothetical protein